MLETVKFLYEHGSDFTNGIVGVALALGGIYVVATWLRITPEPAQVSIPDDITIRFVHHHFALTDANLPDDEDDAPLPAAPATAASEGA